jgi:hypothetical protein
MQSLHLRFWSLPSGPRRWPRSDGRAGLRPCSRAPYAPCTRTCRAYLHFKRKTWPRYFPDGPLTIVPLALALATLLPSAEDAILLAANIGGDSDSVASIAGGILGAMYPNTVNQRWHEVVEAINKHNLEALADELAPFRHGCSHPEIRVD